MARYDSKYEGDKIRRRDEAKVKYKEDIKNKLSSLFLGKTISDIGLNENILGDIYGMTFKFTDGTSVSLLTMSDNLYKDVTYLSYEAEHSDGPSEVSGRNKFR